jgi:hypothetical protein
MENSMLDTVRLYIEVIVAIATMATLGLVGAFAAFAWTGSRELAFLVAAAGLVFTGIVLALRQWRLRRKPASPAGPPA